MTQILHVKYTFPGAETEFAALLAAVGGDTSTVASCLAAYLARVHDKISKQSDLVVVQNPNQTTITVGFPVANSDGAELSRLYDTKIGPALNDARFIALDRILFDYSASNKNQE